MRDWRVAATDGLQNIFAKLRGDILASEETFAYRGFEVRMDSKDIRWDGVGRRTVRVALLHEGRELAHRMYAPDDTFSPSGLITTLQDGLTSLRLKIGSEKAAIKRDDQTLAAAREAAATPFARMDELHAMRGELKALRIDMGLEKPPRAGTEPDADRARADGRDGRDGRVLPTLGADAALPSASGPW